MVKRTRVDGASVNIDGETYRYLAISKPELADLPGLTKQQQEVARQVWGGATNSEIAKALGISANTVSNHVSAIFSRVGVGSRLELVEWVSRFQ